MVEGARHLVAGQALASVLLQPFRVEWGAVAKCDTGDDVLGAILAGAADDGDVFDVRVGAHGLLDLVRVHVEAAGDDDLLDARHQTDEAVGLHDGHVAGAEPAVVEGLLGGLWVVEVAGEHLRAAREQLAGFAVGHGLAGVVRVRDADLGVREWYTDVAGAPVAVEGVAAQDRGGFGEPVAFDELSAGDAFPQLNGALRQGCGTGDRAVEGGEVHILFDGPLCNPLVQQRHAGQEGRASLQDGLLVELRLRCRDEHHLAGDGQREPVVQRQAVDVKHRQDGQHLLVDGAPILHPLCAGDQDGEHVGVRQRHALGGAGGAGGVQDERGVGLCDGRQVRWCGGLRYEGFPRDRLRCGLV